MGAEDLFEGIELASGAVSLTTGTYILEVEDAVLNKNSSGRIEFIALFEVVESVGALAVAPGVRVEVRTNSDSPRFAWLVEQFVVAVLTLGADPEARCAVSTLRETLGAVREPGVPSPLQGVRVGAEASASGRDGVWTEVSFFNTSSN